jgi:hypothetical protein
MGLRYALGSSMPSFIIRVEMCKIVAVLQAPFWRIEVNLFAFLTPAPEGNGQFHIPVGLFPRQESLIYIG